jgi:hypothetical protein
MGAALGHRLGSRYTSHLDDDGAQVRPQSYQGLNQTDTPLTPDGVARAARDHRNQLLLGDQARLGSPDAAQEKELERDLEAIRRQAGVATAGTAPPSTAPRTAAERHQAAVAAADHYGLSPDRFVVGDFGAPMLAAFDLSDARSVSDQQWQRIQADFPYLNAGLDTLGIDASEDPTTQAIRLAALRNQSGFVNEDGVAVVVAPTHRISQQEWVDAAVSGRGNVNPALAAKFRAYEDAFAPLPTETRPGELAAGQLVDLANRKAAAFPP